MADFVKLCELMQQAILSGDAASTSPEKWLKPKPNRPMEEMLDPYVNAYRWRLIDAVSEDYHALRHYLQEERMGALLERYVEKNPPTHYSLVPYCQQFSRYIADDDTLRQDSEANVEFASELAILECAITEVFHMEESPPLTPEDVARLDPARFGEAVLQPRDASQLYSFHYPVNDYLNAVNKEQHPEPPTARESYVAVFRHQYQVWRMGLVKTEFALLQKLSQGLCVGEAIGAVVDEQQIEPEELMEPIGRWFNKWVNDGLLQKNEFFADKQ